MKEKLLLIAWVFINIVVFWVNVSMAYLDPSAMTYIIQVVAGIVIALSTSIGILFYKLKRKMSKKKKQADKVNEETNNISEIENKKED